MTEANANLGRVFGPQDPRSLALAADRNLQNGSFDANMFRAPDSYVYIYTVSGRDFLVSQPPLFPRLWIRPRAKGERATLVCKLPNPFQQIDREGAVGDLMCRAHDARYVAASICNPNNPSLNQDAVLPEGSILGIGVDLTSQGVFWSLNNPVKEEEIVAAEKRRERYYRFLLERARTLEISNPKELENLVNQDYHMAADYFNIETGWHKKLTRYMECPLCGEQIKEGVAAHKNTLGGTCILDEERARKMGLAGAIAPTKGSVGESTK